MPRRLLSLALVVGVAAVIGTLGAGVYASGGSVTVFGVSASTAPPPPPPTTTTVAPKPTPSPSPTTLTDGIDPALVGEDLLKPGTTGPAVLALEKRLKQLHFDIGSPDATYDEATVDAVMAFQKLADLDRDGVAGPKTRFALAQRQPPVKPLVEKDAPPSRLEIDMTRQVMLLWWNNELSTVIPVSTGSGQWFVVEEEFRVSIAVTDPGAFEIGRKYPDWDKGPLGSLYKPMYFDGGIAIHGYPSVPPYPASHGCVRTPMHTQDWLFDLIPGGFPVFVFGKSPAPDGPEPPTPTRPPAPGSTPTAQPPPPTSEPPTSAPGSTTTPTS